MAYVSVDEFLRRIKKPNATSAERDQAQEAIDAAAQEIDAYLSTQGIPPVLTPEQLAIVSVVNVERAAEHFQIHPHGTLPGGPDVPPVFTARDSFYRHTRTLQTLKTSWGIA